MREPPIRYDYPAVSGSPDSYIIYQFRDDGTVEIQDICVNVNRRTGVGGLLIQVAVDAAREGGAKRIWAITRDTNFIAQEFYEALKFRSIPLRDFYGNGGVDAIMYVRDLDALT